MSARTRHAVLAAGGTGGHMFPAQALARELLAREVSVSLVTDRRGGGFGPDLMQVETHFISAGGLAGAGLMGKALGAMRLTMGTAQAYRLLRHLGADTVVGFGGYASVPTVLAGTWRGLCVVLHEQNAVLGRANRLLAARAQAIATAFDTVDGIADADQAKVRVTGNPVRAAIAALGHRPYAVPGEADPLRLLVIGGSQGATIFNEVVPDALCRLPAPLRARLRVDQQVRGPAIEPIAAAYRARGVSCDLRAFFDDMPARLAAAHLVIARAGASTIAELAAAGRPGLLVPYPAATDDHQSANAYRLVEAGGGWLLPQATLSAERLAERLETLLSDPSLLARAGGCARAIARGDAARALADLVCTVSNGDDSRADRGRVAA